MLKEVGEWEENVNKSLPFRSFRLFTPSQSDHQGVTVVSSGDTPAASAGHSNVEIKAESTITLDKQDFVTMIQRRGGGGNFKQTTNAAQVERQGVKPNVVDGWSRHQFSMSSA